jgi:hypothetical protein
MLPEEWACSAERGFFRPFRMVSADAIIALRQFSCTKDKLYDIKIFPF